MRKTTAVSIAIVGMLTTGLGFAANPSSLPPEHHQNGVSFVSGGVGQQEAQAFERAEGKYPLALEMLDRVGKRDEFTAGAKVNVLDAHGKTILSTIADGPFLLARVPNGQYTVSASYEGKTIKRKVSVGPK